MQSVPDAVGKQEAGMKKLCKELLKIAGEDQTNKIRRGPWRRVRRLRLLPVSLVGMLCFFGGATSKYTAGLSGNSLSSSRS